MIEIDLNYYEKTGKTIPLGIQYEDEARAVVYDMTALIDILGDGTFEFYYKHKTRQAQKMTGTTRVGNIAKVKITKTETAYLGDGDIQFIFNPTTPSNSEYRSPLFNTKIEKSIGNDYFFFLKANKDVYLYRDRETSDVYWESKISVYLNNTRVSIPLIGGGTPSASWSKVSEDFITIQPIGTKLTFKAENEKDTGTAVARIYENNVQKAYDRDPDFGSAECSVNLYPPAGSTVTLTAGPSAASSCSLYYTIQ